MLSAQGSCGTVGADIASTCNTSRVVPPLTGWEGHDARGSELEPPVRSGGGGHMYGPRAADIVPYKSTTWPPSAQHDVLGLESVSAPSCAAARGRLWVSGIAARASQLACI